MDRIKYLEDSILKTYNTYKASFKNSNSPIKHLIVVDKESKNYMLLWTGFERRKHVHILLFHAAIQNEKVWIHKDKSEAGLSDLLIQEGLQEKDIVLAYFSPAYREFTDFAVA